MHRRRVHALVAALLLVAPACTDEGPEAVPSLTFSATPSAAPAGQPLAGLTLTARSPAGAPAANVTLSLTVLAGGGEVDLPGVTTDADGRVPVAWTLGLPPILNTLHAQSADGVYVATVTVAARVDVPPIPADFGDVHAFLTAAAIDGSTEDLSFGPDGALVLGVPGGLVRLDAAAYPSLVALTGDPLVGPLGVAHDHDGVLYVADSAGQALRRVSPDGVVTTVVTADVDGPLVAPNHVAVGPDGAVYLSDPCKGGLYRVDPAAGAIVGGLALDLPTQGGPNGLAFDDAGDLWFTTENTRLLCGHESVEVTAPVAGLFRTRWDGAAFAPPIPVAEGLGLFGDGLAFDVEGNLYAIFDTEADFALEESILYVFHPGDPTPHRFFALGDGRVLANPHFGAGAFGEQTLYLTLLAIPPFTSDDSRGVVRVDVGVAGRPLPTPRP